MLELEDIAVWTQRELRKKRRKMWVHPTLYDSRNSGLFWTIFGDLRRGQAKFFDTLECLWTLEEMQETVVYCIQKRQI